MHAALCGQVLSDFAIHPFLLVFLDMSLALGVGCTWNAPLLMFLWLTPSCRSALSLLSTTLFV